MPKYPISFKRPLKNIILNVITKLLLSEYMGVQYNIVLVVVNRFIKIAHYIFIKGDIKA